MCATTAAEMSIIVTKAGVPSCIRVPPEEVAATTGSRSAVARRIAATTRPAAARPIDPPRKRNSPTTSATSWPPIRACPVITDSSQPDRSAAAASDSWYSAESALWSSGSSQEV